MHGNITQSLAIPSHLGFEPRLRHWLAILKRETLDGLAVVVSNLCGQTSRTMAFTRSVDPSGRRKGACQEEPWIVRNRPDSHQPVTISSGQPDSGDVVFSIVI